MRITKRRPRHALPPLIVERARIVARQALHFPQHLPPGQVQASPLQQSLPAASIFFGHLSPQHVSSFGTQWAAQFSRHLPQAEARMFLHASMPHLPQTHLPCALQASQHAQPATAA